MIQPAYEVVEQLQNQALTGIGELFEGVDSSLWVDFSDHGNVGDSAIWLGQERLMRHRGVRIDAVLPTAATTGEVLGALLQRFPDAAVAIQGGGNFGGLYDNHHRARLAALKSSAGRLVLQAPQSVHYLTDDTKEQLRQASRVPAELRSAVRDRSSTAKMLMVTDEPVFLVPDSAHLLGRISAAEPIRAVQVLRRTDKESPMPGGGTASGDWLKDSPGQRVAWTARSASLRLPTARSVFGRLPTSVYTGVAQRRLRRGVDVLARGQVVVTDRLHAMILALHIGREVVAVDNSIGKLSAYYETWLKPVGAPVSIVDSWDEANRFVLRTG
jgi:pyruvyl transferase EpsO